MAIGMAVAYTAELVMLACAAILMAPQRLLGLFQDSLACLFRRGTATQLIAQPTAADGVLPPQSGRERLCVALDLDETLVHTFHRELPTSVLLSDLAYIKLYLPRTIATDAKQPPNQASLLAPVHSLWVSSLATVEQLVVYFLKSMGLGWALYLWGGAKHAMLGTGNNDAGSHHSHSCWDNNNSVGSYPQHINCDRSSSPRNLQQQGSSTCQAASHSGDTYPVWVVERPGARSFLRRVSTFAELVLYTAAAPEYAYPVLQLLLDPDGSLFQGRLIHRRSRPPAAVTGGISYNQQAGTDIHRSMLLQTEGLHKVLPAVKDLGRLGRPLARSLLVDDNSAAFLLHPSNGVPCKSWTGTDASDDHLSAVILPLLQSLALFPDVRPILEARFRLRDWYIKKGLLAAPHPGPPMPPAEAQQGVLSSQQHGHVTCATTSTLASVAMSTRVGPAPRAGHVSNWVASSAVMVMTQTVANTSTSIASDFSRTSAASSCGPQYSSDTGSTSDQPHGRYSAPSGYEGHSDEGHSGLRPMTTQSCFVRQHSKMQTLW